MIVGAVVLAAGKSERMGKNKLLLPLNGKTLIDTVLDALANLGIRDPIVVLGARPDELIKAIKPRLNTVKIVINERHMEGMTSSFQKGLQLLPYVDAAFLALGDQPIFEPGILRSMIRQMESSQGKTLIVSPIHEGKKGHPLLFRRQLFDEIVSLKNPLIIRDVVHRHSDRLVTVEAPEWIKWDVDTPEDYLRIVDLIKAGQIR